MAKTILIRPIITEKAEQLSEGLNQYSFVVHKSANKVEIRKAVEQVYGVSVEGVNTMILPSKSKIRNTRSGIQRGRVASYKKAVVTLGEGEELDFYGDI